MMVDRTYAGWETFFQSLSVLETLAEAQTLPNLAPLNQAMALMTRLIFFACEEADIADTERMECIDLAVRTKRTLSHKLSRSNVDPLKRFKDAFRTSISYHETYSAFPKAAEEIPRQSSY